MSAIRNTDGAPSLADPATCGEDLSYNLRRAAELAQEHCGDCADYHIWTPASRLTGRRRSTDADRQRFALLLSGELSRMTSVGEVIDIVIAGAGDTGILATAAHAAHRVGGEMLRRCRFTVLDLCATPVSLCKDFGIRHGLTVEGEAGDITRCESERSADIIIMHGVLRFIVREMHETVLRRMGERLKPGGRIVLSNRLNPDPNPRASSLGSGALVLQMISEGRIECPEPVEQFTARIKRYMENRRIVPENEIKSAEAARSLIEKAGLLVLRFDAFDEAIRGSSPRVRSLGRIHAVLGAPS